jgi:hypothetical protein
MALHKFGGAALLASVYTRLTTDILTSAYKTYNYVPPNATFPYVMIGGMIGGKSADWTSSDIKGEDLVIHAHIWSSYQGDSEAATMMNNVIQAITATDLSITGYTTLKGIPDFSQIMIDATDPNNLLRHGVCRFRFQIA